MKYERWLIPETDDAAVEALMDAGYPYLVSTVLASRGVVTPEQAAAHLDRAGSGSLPLHLTSPDRGINTTICNAR